MSYRMKEITINPQQIAACGLYCGACKKFLNGKCPGCKENEKASWCKIRKCCQEKDLHTCAECDKDVTECKIHNNFVGKIFAFLFIATEPPASVISEKTERMPSRRRWQKINR